MNINRYLSVNASISIIGLFSDITILISMVSIYHAVKIIKNSFKFGICTNKKIVLIVSSFLLLDAADVVSFTIGFL